MIASLVMLPLIHHMIMRQLSAIPENDLGQSINAGYYGATYNLMN
jgi:hypothetical protein